MMNAEVKRFLYGVTHADTRKVLKAAISAGVRYRITRAGILFYGEDGTSTVCVHKTQSDHRAMKNMLADFRKIGFHPPKK